MSSFPGSDTLRFARVYRRMLHELPRVEYSTARGSVRPLEQLNLHAESDFALALVSGWAAIAEIVRFYNDRIEDEGYLPTAVEPFSILCFARFLGYTPRPAIAAQTWLALTVSTTTIPQDKALSRTVTVPAGANLVVQNIPSQGAMPVIFEAIGAIEARAEWNAILPAIPTETAAAVLYQGMRGIRLAGAVSGLRPGSGLLLITEQASYFRVLTTIDTQRIAGYTLVLWDDGIELQGSDNKPQSLLALHTFKQQAGLFGRRAQAWDTAPESTRRSVGVVGGGVMVLRALLPGGGLPDSVWRPSQGNLPQAAVNMLAYSSGLFAATAQGLYSTVSTGRDADWQVRTAAPARQDVQSLLIAPGGLLYMGGERGALSFSPDEGATWQSIRFPLILPPPPPVPPPGPPSPPSPPSFWSALMKFMWWWVHLLFPPTPAVEATPVSSPSQETEIEANTATAHPSAPVTTPFTGVVSAIATGVFQGAASSVLLAGTDQGVFWMVENSIDWQSFALGLPGYNQATGLASTVVYALYADLPAGYLYAGTSEGLFATAVPPVPDPAPETLPCAAWRAVNLLDDPDSSEPDSPTPKPQPAVTALLEFNDVLLAGTSLGLFVFHEGEAATRPSAGLPRDCRVTSLAAGGGPSPVLLLGSDAGVFTSTDGEHWSELPWQEVAYFTVENTFGFPPPETADGMIPLPSLLLDLFRVHGTQLPGGTAASVLVAGVLWSIAAVEPAAHAPGHGRFLLRSEEGRLIVTAVTALSSVDVSAVTVAPDGTCYMATPTTGLLESEWPGFQLEGGAFPLDRVVTGITAGSYAVLQQTAPSACTVVTQVASSEQSAMQQYGRQATVSVITPEAKDAHLGLLRQRDTTVYLRSSPLAAFTPTLPVFSPVHGQTVLLAESIETLRPGQPIAITALRPSGLIVQAGGLLAVHKGTAPIAFSQEQVVALVEYDSVLHAAVEGVGIYRNRSDETAWEFVAPGSCPVNATCLCVAGDRLLAGDAAGVWSWTGAHPEWVKWHGSPGHVLSLAADATGTVFAGAPDGVYRTGPEADTWQQLFVERPLCEVLALTLEPDGTLYAACTGGVARFPNQETEGALETATDFVEISSLLLNGTDLYAGTLAGGVFLRSPAGMWQPLHTKELAWPVQCLAMDEETLLAGTQGGGVQGWQVGSWRAVHPSPSNNVACLLVSTNGSLLAGCRTRSFLHGAPAAPVPLDRTPLFTAPAYMAAELDLETVSAELTAFFLQSGVVLSSYTVTVEHRGRLWTLRNGGLAYALHLRNWGLDSAVLCVAKTPVLTVLGRTQPVSNGEQVPVWTLQSAAGLSGTLPLADADLQMGPGVAGSTAAEVFTLESSRQTVAGNTLLTAQAPLAGMYDIATASLTANLAPATQGSTVSLEVLGSGNASQPNQSFTLKRPPLTWTYDPNSTDLDCSLQVYVNSNGNAPQPSPALVNPLPVTPTPTGQPWTRVETLFGCGSHEQVYTLSESEQGVATVRFGDGVEGARLPSGVSNVLATYRSGTGPDGNVVTGSLAVFRKRPLGLRAVSNPVPGSLGTSAEPTVPAPDPITGGNRTELVPTTRSRLNLLTRAIDRIVTFDDYRNFALAHSEVVKVDTRILTIAGKPLIHLTVSLAGGRSIEAVPGAVRALERAIENARADRRALQVQGYSLLFFDLGVQLTIASGQDANAVRTLVFERLRYAFAPDARSFAQDVTADDVTTIILRVPSVLHVHLHALYFSGLLPARNEQLVARKAHVHGEMVVAAQLLCLSPTLSESAVEVFS